MVGFLEVVDEVVLGVRKKGVELGDTSSCKVN